MVSLVTLIIGIGLLVGGLLVMRYGLKRLLWRRLYTALSAATLTPWRGLLAGTVAATLFQSSTAVCLLTIGLVSADYLTFRRSFGIILGANIGTCSTVGLIGFINTESIAPLLLLLSIICFLAKRTRDVGVAFIGLASMFYGLFLLERGIVGLQKFSVIQELLLMAKDGPLQGIAAGVIITFLFQSSSAATAMLMSLTEANIFELATAAYIVYGANLGSCLSSVLVSAVAPLAAKRVAAAHVLLNVFGICVFLPVSEQFVSFIMQMSADPAVQVAALHTAFNVVSSILVLPVSKPFSRAIEALLPSGRTVWR